MARKEGDGEKEGRALRCAVASFRRGARAGTAPHIDDKYSGSTKITT